MVEAESSLYSLDGLEPRRRLDDCLGVGQAARLAVLTAERRELLGQGPEALDASADRGCFELGGRAAGRLEARSGCCGRAVGARQGQLGLGAEVLEELALGLDLGDVGLAEQD